MTFIGILSDNKSFENINMHLKSDKLKLIHINKKSIENVKNIRFETIIIDLNLENFEHEENIIQQICINSKYLIINTDINLKFNLLNNKIKIITYGLNHKATFTVSSITDTDILIYMQRNIRTKKNQMVEVGEKRIKIGEKSKLKIYEILIIYIIFLVNNDSIIEQI